MKLLRIIAVFGLTLISGAALAQPVYWLSLTGEHNGQALTGPRTMIGAHHRHSVNLGPPGNGKVLIKAVVKAIPVEADAVALEMILNEPSQSGAGRLETAATVVHLSELTDLRLDKEERKMSLRVLLELAEGEALPPPQYRNHGEEVEPPGIQTQAITDF
ncbi:MAG: hypothetical protein ACPGZP_06000 [Panacagrimonas sp.]